MTRKVTRHMLPQLSQRVQMRHNRFRVTRHQRRLCNARRTNEWSALLRINCRSSVKTRRTAPQSIRCRACGWRGIAARVVKASHAPHQVSMPPDSLLSNKCWITSAKCKLISVAASTTTSKLHRMISRRQIICDCTMTVATTTTTLS